MLDQVFNIINDKQEFELAGTLISKPWHLISSLLLSVYVWYYVIKENVMTSCDHFSNVTFVSLSDFQNHVLHYLTNK